ncbi:ATP-dependent DNA helicase recG [Melia azedarach]|uniref:ATP-dependent DNA helicase recG n=1 Tax=Melia azedarach TaxID=155640 RepID=A0ACC1XFS1_MELAZ|nr:ATP-dependent DNA helicase recG [Melia azedarach]
MDDFGVSLACKRFSSSTLGNSPPVESYDETKSASEMRSLLAAQSYEAFVTDTNGAKWVVDSDIPSEAWPSLGPGPTDVSSSVVGEEGFPSLPVSCLSVPLETGEELNDLRTVKESLESSVEALLDGCISCVPGLCKRLYRQVENCGFHTVGSLEIL